MTWLEHLPYDLPWLVWLLLFVLFGPWALSSKLAAKIPGILGMFGRWRQEQRMRAADSDRADRTAIRLKALEDDLQEMQTSHVKQLDVMQEQLDAQSTQLEAQAEIIAKLRVDQAATDRNLSEVTSKFWAAVGYIRRLADALSRHAEVPPPPESLRDILA